MKKNKRINSQFGFKIVVGSGHTGMIIMENINARVAYLGQSRNSYVLDLIKKDLKEDELSK